MLKGIVVSAKRALGIGLLAAVVTVTVSAKPRTPIMRTQATAVVTVAAGEPFVLIRGAGLYLAGTAVSVSSGDMIETKSDTLLILDFHCGDTLCAVAALGPSTRAYWMDRPEGVTFALLSGWIKVDNLTANPPLAIAALGTHLGASTNAGVFVLHAEPVNDEVFEESGSMALWVQKSDGTGVSRTSRPNEFASRGGNGEIQILPRPASAFAQALPAAFRDGVPQGMSAKLHGKAEPKFVRDVSYEDVADWLGAPREWRQRFVMRFRPRLKDQEFFHSLDLQMNSHPEWNLILHPPPPPPPIQEPSASSDASADASGEALKRHGEGRVPESNARVPPAAADGDSRSQMMPKHVSEVIPLPESETSMKACPFPEEARQQGQTGSVGLLVYISTDGAVLNAAVTDSSGSEALDKAAVTCVQQKGQFPPVRNGASGNAYWGHMKFHWG